MEIKKTISAPEAFVFNKIIESSLYDIERNTGSRPSLEALSDYEYVKEFGANRYGRIKFNEVKSPAVYDFSTYTSKNTYHTRWEIKGLAGGGCQVVIREKQEALGFFQKVNDALLGLALGWIKRRQMEAIIDGISLSYNGS